MREQYSFNISLSVLNHLGRNLYRNIITVIGEAISNSWDADAHNVSEEAAFDIPSYTDCFVAENLLRKYIKYQRLSLSKDAIEEAERWKKRDEENRNRTNISYAVRMSSDDIFYLDMDHLANFVDKAQDKIKDPGISRSAVIYKPLRDAIGHTSIITEDAKT